MTAQPNNAMAIANRIAQPILWLGVAPLLPLIGLMWLFSRIESEEEIEIVPVEKTRTRKPLTHRPNSGIIFTLEASQ